MLLDWEISVLNREMSIYFQKLSALLLPILWTVLCTSCLAVNQLCTFTKLMFWNWLAMPRSLTPAINSVFTICTTTRGKWSDFFNNHIDQMTWLESDKNIEQDQTKNQFFLPVIELFWDRAFFLEAARAILWVHADNTPAKWLNIVPSSLHKICG